jgi:hypothetical protein
MIVWAEHLYVQRAAILPSIRGRGTAPVASKVNDDGIAWQDGRIVDEVRHEGIFDGSFRGLAIQEHADMVARDMEIVHEPAFDFARVVDTRRQIPDLAGFVLVDPDNEGENRGRHPTKVSSIKAISRYNMRDLLWIGGNRVIGGDGDWFALSFEGVTCDSRKQAVVNSHTSGGSHTFGEESTSSCSQRVSPAINLYKHLEIKGSSTTTIHPTPQRENCLPEGGDVHAATSRS